MIYATLDRSITIESAHLKAALAFWDYADRSAAFIFGDKLGNPDADAILNALRREREGMTRTAIRDLFLRNLSAARIERALDMLTRAGKVRCESRKANEAGRPAEVWRAVQK
jgi:hypothetical protein